jgi:hypothetical protein
LCLCAFVAKTLKMEELNDGLKIYSEEVRDVLSDPPKAILKWGNSILLGFIMVLFLLSWFIKYPDVINSQVLITTNIPPQKLVSKVSGKIDTIFVKDRTIVNKNTALAIIENTANYKDVFLLKSIIDTIKIDSCHFPFAVLKMAQLGDIERDYASFKTAYITDSLNTKLQPFKVQGVAQSSEMIQIKERINLLESQKSIS